MTKWISALIFASVAVIIAVIDLSSGFSFDGQTVPCKGVNVTGYPKMREQYLRCNKTTYEDFKKRGETPDMVNVLLSVVMCSFKEDKLVDTKTGFLNKASLDNYKDMFEHIPKEVRKEIKNTFYNCFEEHKNDTVYNTKTPTDCNGILGVAVCIKSGIDKVCSPENSSEDDE